MPKEMFDYNYRLHLVSDEAYNLDCTPEEIYVFAINFLVGKRLRIHLTPHPEAHKSFAKGFVMVTLENSNPVEFIGMPRHFLKQIEM